MTTETTNKAPKHYLEVWHKKNGRPCLAWYISRDGLERWKQQQPLKGEWVLMPTTLARPLIGERIECGTCGATFLAASTKGRELLYGNPPTPGKDLDAITETPRGRY